MTSLREEIQEIISSIMGFNGQGIYSDKEATNEIISKIEKRTDELKMPSNFLQHEMEYAVGFGEAITKVKEMLK